MNEYFDRNGNQVNLNCKSYELNKKGNQGHYYVEVVCSRCGGLGGSDHWKHTGYTCFRCNASTRRNSQGRFLDPSSPLRIPFYSLEKLQSLQNAAAKRYQKKADLAEAKEKAFLEEYGDLLECGEYYSKYSPFIKSVITQAKQKLVLTSNQESALIRSFVNAQKIALKEQQKTNDFIGKIGERIEHFVESVKVIGFQGNYGPFYINIFKDNSGNTLVYKGSSPYNEGFKGIIKFTVKDHEVYNEKKQTVISRMKTISKEN